MNGRSEQLQGIADALLSATSIAICAHVDPDGDAIGSTLGLAHLLRGCGANVTALVASASKAPTTFAFLPGALDVQAASAIQSVDLFVALDSPDVNRLGDAGQLALSARRLIVIDHHPDNRLYGTSNLVDEHAAATGELIWELLPFLGCTPDATVATCLLTALITDTGRFSYGNTTPAALRHAAEMIESGASISTIYRHVYESRSPGTLALIARALGRLTFANEGHVAYSWLTLEDFEDTGAAPEDAENLIDEIRVVRGADTVALLKTSTDGVRVSLRAKNGYDVGLVARTLGGGGHAAAAGFTRTGDIDSVVAELLPLLPSAS